MRNSFIAPGEKACAGEGRCGYRLIAPGREGGQIMMSAPSRAGRRAAKTLDHRAIPAYRPMV